MFELSIALKYLIPRWRQLSISIISMISVLVISLVVWLVVVFFSVTDGLEKGWIQKLIAFTAPVRITPTEQYYHSYYYLIDSLSEASDYTQKSIAEKRISPVVDPYDPTLDQEVPAFWSAPDLNADGSLKDLVKEAFRTVDDIDGVSAVDYEITYGNLRIKMMREETDSQTGQYQQVQRSVSQACYLNSLDSDDTGYDPQRGYGIVLAKTFQDHGVLIKDRGYISYYSPTASTVQEQRIPVYIAGFYDPGIIPLGGKFVSVSREVTNSIRQAYDNTDHALNGINVHFSDIGHAEKVKKTLQQRFSERGINKYWKVETYREYDFTKDLIQQLQSERHLFTLIALIIIIVACSNIISMLIILVHDKKREIGILRSMGASSRSIGIIFALSGVIMGIIGSTIGTVAAFFTLKNLNWLVDKISALQGHELFHETFYGEFLPQDISIQALSFVLVTTVIISLLSGIIPAVKASKLQPSIILRAEQ